MNMCKQRYLRVADKEAEKRLDKLLDFLAQNNIGFITMGERWEGSHQFVQVTVDIKVSGANGTMSIEKKIRCETE